MAVDAKGYETKPWWPYVRELMEGGGSVTVEQLNVTENGTYTAEAGKAYSPIVVNVPAAGVTASVTFVADEGFTLLGVMAGSYLVDGNQTYTAENPTNYMAGVATTVPILDSIVLYDLVCFQDQSTPLKNVAFDLAGDAEFNLNNEIVITGNCMITVKNEQ